MNNDLRRQDDEMIYDLEKRLDRHLEIYANNGKEMARLAIAVETMAQNDKERDVKVDEMFIAYQEFKNGRKAIVWLIGGLFSIFMTVGGAILMAKQILK